MLKAILALIVVVYLGFQAPWHYTLSGDIRNYYFPLAQHVFTDQTLIYPPGANLFFLALSAFSLEFYEWVFVAANGFLAIILLSLTRKPLVFSLLLLAAGPIVLFRFDLLVIVLTAAALLAWQKSRYHLAGAFLGLAAATKVFPAVLLPYLLWVLWSEKGWRLAGKFLAAFFLAGLGVLAVFAFVTKLDLATVVTALSFNFSKSVHMESVVGTVLAVVTAFTNPGPHGVVFLNALWVLSPLYFLGHDRIFRLIPFLGLAAVYLALILSRRPTAGVVSRCLLIILVLITTSQALSPQYVLWPTFLMLLLPVNKTDLFLALLALVCTQIVYPLNYGGLIDFFNWGINPWLFGVLVVRNLTLVVLTLRLFRHEIFLPVLPKKKSPLSF